ncbi:hypothetical protein Tco_0550823 [Tanacetum coccineum]
MSNTNNNLQTQTSNALHNAIMEAGGKDHPPMLAPGNYTEKTVPVAEGSSETTTEGIDNDIYSTIDACPNACEMWKAIKRLKQGESINVQDLEPIYTGSLENSHHEMVNHLNRITQVYHPQNHLNHYTQNSSIKSQPAATRNRGKAIVNSPPPTYDQEPIMVADDDEMSKEKEIDKLMALISLSFKKIYKPTNNISELHQTPVEQIKIII